MSSPRVLTLTHCWRWPNVTTKKELRNAALYFMKTEYWSQPSLSVTTDIIIGGGIAGVSAASELAATAHVIGLEKEPQRGNGR